MRDSCSACFVYLLQHVEVSLYLNFKCGFYSPITLIQSGQTTIKTNKQTNTQLSSYNNIYIYNDQITLRA